MAENQGPAHILWETMHMVWKTGHILWYRMKSFLYQEIDYDNSPDKITYEYQEIDYDSTPNIQSYRYDEIT